MAAHTAQPWISRGLKLDDYRRWYAAGVTDAKVVQTWRYAVHAGEDFDDSDDFRITMMKRYEEPDVVPYDSR